MTSRNLFSYTYWHDTRNVSANFSYSLKYASDEQIDAYFNDLLKVINDKRKQIKKLKSIQIESIKDDLDAKIYNSLVDFGIKNMFNLGSSLSNHPQKGVISRISNIGTVKGEKIVEVMNKYGYPTSREIFYTTVPNKEEY